MLPELVPVSHVTGMRPKATAANKVELLGFHWHNRKPHDVKTQIWLYLLTFSFCHHPFSICLEVQIRACYYPFSIMQQSAWCCRKCNICLGDSKHFSCITSGEMNHILNEKYWVTLNNHHQSTLSASCCHTNVVQRGCGQCLLQSYITLLWDEA